MSKMGGTPVLILKEGTERQRGKTAQKTNIMAAVIVGEAVKSTLGPRGMDKMLVDNFGDVTITNDGATILQDIDVQHPAAKIMVQVAKTQDDEAGDGTTTAVVLAGELLKQAEDLLNKGVHPTVIIEGYKAAVLKAEKELKSIANPIDPSDLKSLEKVAITTMASKAVMGARELLAKIAVQAVNQICEVVNGERKADIDLVKIVKKEGKGLNETEYVEGLVVDKEIVHAGMPKRIENAKIALINTALEVEKTEFDAKINITDPDQVQAFLDQEEQMMREMADKIVKSGANIVFAQKGIDDMVQFFLAEKGIAAVRRVKKSDMEKLAKATKAKIITNLDMLKPEKKILGSAGLVEEVKMGDDEMVYVHKCKDPRAVTIVIRGGAEQMINEAERAIHDALCTVRDVVEDGLVVPGGGAVEIELAQRIKKYADTLSGREQLAAKLFAKSLEVIPSALSDNAGYDPIDILASLRSLHEKKGYIAYGVDIDTGKTKDMIKLGVLEPYRVKLQALKSASEAAQMILRIDDIIAAKKGGAPGGPPGGPESPDLED